MDNNEGIKKYFVKNKYNFIFSILAVFSFLFFIFSAAKLDLKINLLNQILGLFSPGMWFLLFLALVISSTLAYFEKFKLLALPLLIWLLIFSIDFRTANVSQLIDVSTGNYTLGPDLDPFLYLRLAQDINIGNLSTADCIRYAPACANNYALSNLMPLTIVIFYRIISLFTDISLTYAAIITSVILFSISIIGFFLFTKTIFSFKIDKVKASLIALIGAILYAVAPSMLHRTTGGIPEIESLGLAFFWFAFLFYALAWKSNNKYKWVIFGVIAAIFTELMSFSWGGYRFIFIVLALATFVIFFLERDIKKNIIIFSSWFIPAIIVEFIKFKSISAVLLSLSGPGAAVAIFLLLILQAIFFKFKLNKKFEKIKLSNSVKILILTLIVGILGLLIIDPKLIITIPSRIIEGLLYPFGKERVSLTVAENAAPYLSQAMAEFGYLVWAFLASIFILFYESVKHFNLKDKIKLNAAFAIFILCFFFTRLSSTSIFSGDNFISHFVYFAGLIIFIVTAFTIDRKNYENKSAFKEIDFSYVLLLAFAFWGIVSMRGAVRLFFIVSPMIILVSAVLPYKLFEYTKKSKDELAKTILIILLITTAIVFFYTFIQYSASSEAQAKATVPGIYEQQWQEAMSWVRENTPQDSVLVHWWDYGYWVQTIGERPTVTDGGHFTAYWDHLIGRYLLTTPFPKTALSFMKTHNVSYLLIDSTDVGKYSAYASIGSDKTGQDRYSWLPVMQSNPSQTQETKNGTIRIYNGGYAIDKDIIYDNAGKKTLLSTANTGLAGVVVEFKNTSISQPEAVFVQNGNQIRIPIRYVYFNGELFDYKKGLNSTVIIFPALVNSNGGVALDAAGAMIYLSEKTKDSLFAKLYLMDDPLNEYPTLKLAHSEPDTVVAYLNSQGANLDYVYYSGFRGPIKIWEVNYPANTAVVDGFLDLSGEYAQFDNSTFTK